MDVICNSVLNIEEGLKRSYRTLRILILKQSPAVSSCWRHHSACSLFTHCLHLKIMSDFPAATCKLQVKKGKPSRLWVSLSFQHLVLAFAGLLTAAASTLCAFWMRCFCHMRGHVMKSGIHLVCPPVPQNEENNLQDSTGLPSFLLTFYKFLNSTWGVWLRSKTHDSMVTNTSYCHSTSFDFKSSSVPLDTAAVSQSTDLAVPARLLAWRCNRCW